MEGGFIAVSEYVCFGVVFAVAAGAFEGGDCASLSAGRCEGHDGGYNKSSGFFFMREAMQCDECVSDDF